MFWWKRESKAFSAGTPINCSRKLQRNTCACSSVWMCFTHSIFCFHGSLNQVVLVWDCSEMGNMANAPVCCRNWVSSQIQLQSSSKRIHYCWGKFKIFTNFKEIRDLPISICQKEKHLLHNMIPWKWFTHLWEQHEALLKNELQIKGNLLRKLHSNLEKMI